MFFFYVFPFMCYCIYHVCYCSIIYVLYFSLEGCFSNILTLWLLHIKALVLQICGIQCFFQLLCVAAFPNDLILYMRIFLYRVEWGDLIWWHQHADGADEVLLKKRRCVNPFSSSSSSCHPLCLHSLHVRVRLCHHYVCVELMDVYEKPNKGIHLESILHIQQHWPTELQIWGAFMNFSRTLKVTVHTGAQLRKNDMYNNLQRRGTGKKKK